VLCVEGKGVNHEISGQHRRGGNFGVELGLQIFFSAHPVAMIELDE
jgi:hypothetical protein